GNLIREQGVGSSNLPAPTNPPGHIGRFQPGGGFSLAGGGAPPPASGACAGLGPPLETATIAGRSTRSSMVKPAWNTCTTVPAGTSVRWISITAWCRCGLNGSL